MKRALAIVVCALALAGCYKTTYQLKPPGGAARPARQYFHLSLINIIEISPPIDLAAECGSPEAAVEIYEGVGVLGAIVNLFLSNFIPILHVHNAAVGCAGGGLPPPPPPPGG